MWCLSGCAITKYGFIVPLLLLLLLLLLLPFCFVIWPFFCVLCFCYNPNSFALINANSKSLSPAHFQTNKHTQRHIYIFVCRNITDISISGEKQTRTLTAWRVYAKENCNTVQPSSQPASQFSAEGYATEKHDARKRCTLHIRLVALKLCNITLGEPAPQRQLLLHSGCPPGPAY